MHSRHSIALALVALFSLSSCQYAEDRYLRREVRAAELLGRWQVTDYGLRSLAAVGHRLHLSKAEHMLFFAADGTCNFQSFVDPTREGSLPTQVYLPVPVPCRWVLSSAPPRQQLTLSVEATSSSPAFVQSYSFDEEDGHLIIWQHVTDPDAWKYLEFVRLP
ncbi:hypothetical protein PLCT1_00175 [Planctomycetaceae bacterium]|nr:hypothetical protein PLCT1_00175 [Planctomycetaceae bacterium]